VISGSDRSRRVEQALKPIALAAVAASVAWLIAHDLVGHPRPFLAPVAALIVVGLTVGQRTRRATQLTIGQAVGILCADLLVARIGTGAAQIGLVVAMVMLVAVVLSPSPLLAQQAAVSGVLVAVLQPPGSGLAGARFVDALIGGAVAVTLNTLVFPTDPLRLVRRRGAPLLAELAATLRDVAEALELTDSVLAESALTRARSLDALAADLADAVLASREMAQLAPRHRAARDAVLTQHTVAAQLDLAVRNARVLARRARRVVTTDERVPVDLVEAIRTLADAVERLQLTATFPEQVGAKDTVLHAAELANACISTECSLSVTVLIAQVRSLVQDLLVAMGVEEDDALRAIDGARAGAATADTRRSA
jgi:uncharacterized membrane protein YgaE (UPF0421/DUF939 family)